MISRVNTEHTTSCLSLAIQSPESGPRGSDLSWQGKSRSACQYRMERDRTERLWNLGHKVTNSPRPPLVQPLTSCCRNKWCLVSEMCGIHRKAWQTNLHDHQRVSSLWRQYTCSKAIISSYLTETKCSCLPQHIPRDFISPGPFIFVRKNTI